MFASATTSPASGFNWYDVVVILAILFGLWSGVRTGFTGELLRAVGWVLTVVLALRFYQPVGQWLAPKFGLAEEFANLVVFVTIAVALYLLQLLVRFFVHAKVKSFKFGAVIENIGGGVAGMVRMGLVMMCLSVALCLVRSPFWHKQVGIESKFGAYVAGKFPAVAAVVQKKFPEKIWITEEIRRRSDPDVENIKPKPR